MRCTTLTNRRAFSFAGDDRNRIEEARAVNSISRRAIPLVVPVLLLVAACSSSPGNTSGDASARPPTQTTSAIPTAAESVTPDPDVIEGSFDVGGRSLHLECRGSGDGPTILYLHGYGGLGAHGSHLFDGYADTHRVCVYDRANMGLSDPSDGTQAGADIAGDLTALMAAAEVPPPYLLVAQSHGGVIAELYAGAQPDDVAGIVFIDASLHSDADLDRYFASIGEMDLEAFQAEYNSEVELTLWTIHDEARAAIEHIPDIPMTYLMAVRAGEPPEPQETRSIWDAGLAELFARSSNATLVEVDGPHDLPPPTVHEAVNDMLELLRLQ